MPEKTLHKKNARRSDQSGRANVENDGRIVSHRERPYDMVRDDPDEWQRGCLGFGIMLCIAWGFGVLWGVLA